MLRTQFAYLLDGTTAVLLGLVAAIAGAALVSASGVALGVRVLDADRIRYALAYRSEAAIAVRMAAVLVAVFIGLHGFARLPRRAALYFVSDRTGLIRFAITRIFAAAVVVVLFLAVLALFEVVVGLRLTPYYVPAADDLKRYLDVLAEALFFLGLQAVVSTLLDSVFAALPCLALYWMLESGIAATPSSAFLYEIVRHGRLPVLPTAGHPFLQTGVLVALVLILMLIFAVRDID